MSEALEFAKNVRDEVINLAIEHPTAVYYGTDTGDLDTNTNVVQACYYCKGEAKTPEGEVVGEGCIVGQAILKVKPELKEILSNDMYQNDDAATIMNICIEHLFGVTSECHSRETYDIVSFLGDFQWKQDRMESWGDALKQSIAS
jgi:hypothetical protein